MAQASIPWTAPRRLIISWEACARLRRVSRSSALGRRADAPTADAHQARRRPEPRGAPAGLPTAVRARPPARHPAGRAPARTPAADRTGRAATARPARPRPWPDAGPEGRGATAEWPSRSRARCWPGRGAARAVGGGPGVRAAPRWPPSRQGPPAPRAASRSRGPPHSERAAGVVIPDVIPPGATRPYWSVLAGRPTPPELPGQHPPARRGRSAAVL